jgi:DNA polymerase I-like protein with 3'-5' exonuclease and polymerase domains
MRTDLNLFDAIEVQEQQAHTWTPPEPPCLGGIDEIEMDFESTGHRWWAEDVPIGVGVATPDGRTWYLPWAHRGGGNLDFPTVQRWFQREVRGKRITNLSTRFEVHMARKIGVDLEAQGNTVSDVGHYAALLDDHRQHFSLESLLADFLPEEQKVKRVGHVTLDVHRMADYHAGVVAARAEADVRQVQKLKRLLWPRLDAEDLQRVRQLEDEAIYPTCEMEFNGAPIDVDLLDRWVIESQEQLNRCYMDIYRATGLNVNPDSPKDMQRLFEHLKLPISRTEEGSPSFTAAILKAIQHPVVSLVARASKLTDLRSKYLLRYAKTVDRSTGILRYALHQLRAQKDEFEDFDAAGTISGRYSCTKIDPKNDEGSNIQQVIKVAKQRVLMGYDEKDASHDDKLFIIRRLHRPLTGLHLSADAMQIEYRLFAEKTRSPRLLKIYEDNPMASFHEETHALLLPFRPELTYRRNKDFNFANIYGAGLRKRALMLEFITHEQYRQLLVDPFWYDSPLLKGTKDISAIYNQLIPEVKPLMALATHLAMPACDKFCRKSLESRRLHAQQMPHRGFVRDILGRRSRFPDGHRAHKGLNCVIQPSAASIMKQKLVELHRERKDTGFLMRWPVHDEVDGDIPDREAARKVGKILNRQSFPLKVPILWEVSVGRNWAECGEKAALVKMETT